MGLIVYYSVCDEALLNLQKTGAVKIGKSGSYPGGKVTLSVDEAIAHLNEVVIFEVGPNIPGPPPMMQARICKIHATYNDTYWFRNEIRLKRDCPIGDILPYSAVRFTLRTEPYHRHNFYEFRKAMDHHFQHEPRVQDHMDEFAYLCMGANGPEDGYRFIIECPPSTHMMVLKLALAA